MSAEIYRTGRRFALGAAATSAHWIGGDALFALGDGRVLVSSSEGETRSVEVHTGAILCATPHPDQPALLTGGDDGKLNIVSADGAVTPVLEQRKWVDHVVASRTSGLIVAGVGKEAIVFREGIEAHRFVYSTTIGGLALDNKGRRLAVSHYGGVTLRYALMADDRGIALNWAGSHLGVTISPDGEYIMTAMQENALHGWRMPDKLDLRMDGYPSKTKSFSWDKRGRWLATSGANSAIVWPFVGKLGPQGKAPMQPGQRDALVTAVAFHPTEELLAIGYNDGVAICVRFADQIGIELSDAGEGAVSALAWSADGRHIAVGDESGRGAIIDT